MLSTFTKNSFGKNNYFEGLLPHPFGHGPYARLAFTFMFVPRHFYSSNFKLIGNGVRLMEYTQVLWVIVLLPLTRWRSDCIPKKKLIENSQTFHCLFICLEINENPTCGS